MNRWQAELATLSQKGGNCYPNLSTASRLKAPQRKKNARTTALERSVEKNLPRV